MRRTAILVEVLAPRLGAAVAMASYAIVGFAVLGAFFGVPMFARAVFFALPIACVLAW